MHNTDTPTVVFVPGLRDHNPDHWQSLLADTLPKTRTVPPLERNSLNLDAREAALDTILSEIDGPVVLVAHSAGVMITVHWAARRDGHQIVGALLVAPPDLETPMPEGHSTVQDLDDAGWLPIPREPLPFPCTVVASTNDPLSTFDRAADFAESWGARLVNAGAVGHLNPISGYGHWEQGHQLLEELLEEVATGAGTDS
jgi:predicted alpha/beta hydrolase family esterase